MRLKLDKVRRLGYIAPGTVKSLTSYISVPKGNNNIRMVYDGTKSGLNGSMWAPWFALPTVERHLRFVGPVSFLGDMDIGDMFHNFMLHKDVCKVAVIDLTPFFPEELAKMGSLQMLWEHWERCATGLQSSPYNAIQGILFAEEIVKSNPENTKNIF